MTSNIHQGEAEEEGQCNDQSIHQGEAEERDRWCDAAAVRGVAGPVAVTRCIHRVAVYSEYEMAQAPLGRWRAFLSGVTSLALRKAVEPVESGRIFRSREIRGSVNYTRPRKGSGKGRDREQRQAKATA